MNIISSKNSIIRVTAILFLPIIIFLSGGFLCPVSPTNCADCGHKFSFSYVIGPLNFDDWGGGSYDETNILYSDDGYTKLTTPEGGGLYIHYDFTDKELYTDNVNALSVPSGECLNGKGWCLSAIIKSPYDYYCSSSDHGVWGYWYIQFPGQAFNNGRCTNVMGGDAQIQYCGGE
ncbi:MAG TPA: hypothetical protein VG537_07685 [Candidatus Kapabacteria bacterium]|jgi:hypothetical protein|nr:hypothetical protein [Candidatus Kapabacteria bacterium]